MKRRRLTTLSLALLIVAGFSGTARACLNDRDSDSLANEAQGLPDVVRVVTGRFERNPPLFYQMRINRVRQEIARHPEHLALYDDVAVAYDRLGKDNEAIAWIEKKRAQLAGTSWKTASPEIREAWYRYYANVGTFRVHRWIKARADRTKLAEVTRARDEIARAIQIKPNAHFNRERYQLAAMHWILNPYVKTLPNDALSATSYWDYVETHSVRGDALAQSEGLMGLIVLGAAWESPDITGALAYSLQRQRKNKVSYLAFLRCRELVDAGRRSLRPDKENPNQTLQAVAPRYLNTRITNPATVEAQFHVLRREADDWQKNRTAFMVARLKRGRHPDTDAAFWQGFQETAPPPLDADWRREWRGNFSNALYRAVPMIIAAVILGAISGSAILWIVTVWRIHAAEKRLQRPTSRPE